MASVPLSNKRPRGDWRGNYETTPPPQTTISPETQSWLMKFARETLEGMPPIQHHQEEPPDEPDIVDEIFGTPGPITEEAVEKGIARGDEFFTTGEYKKKKPYVTFITTMGVIEIETYPDHTPLTVRNFVELAKRGYYNGVLFHRILPGLAIQGGDPTGTGTGGESIYGKCFKDEITDKMHHTGAGIVSMANAGPNTNGSQFLITLAATPHLDGLHTIFGRIYRGMRVVEEMAQIPTNEQNRPLMNVSIISATITDAPSGIYPVQPPLEENFWLHPRPPRTTTTPRPRSNMSFFAGQIINPPPPTKEEIHDLDMKEQEILGYTMPPHYAFTEPPRPQMSRPNNYIFDKLEGNYLPQIKESRWDPDPPLVTKQELLEEVEKHGFSWEDLPEYPRSDKVVDEEAKKKEAQIWEIAKAGFGAPEGEETGDAGKEFDYRGRVRKTMGAKGTNYYRKPTESISKKTLLALGPDSTFFNDRVESSIPVLLFASTCFTMGFKKFRCCNPEHICRLQEPLMQ